MTPNRTPAPNSPADSAALVRRRLASYLSFYEDQAERLADFWVRHSRDEEYGGFLHQLNHRGEVIGTDKFLWCQARQTWTFAAFWNHLAKRDVWLEMAQLGRRFLIEHGYLGQGRWAYLCSREGVPLNKALSLATDNNTAMALAELAIATGDHRDSELIRATFDQYLDKHGPPAADEWYHHRLTPDRLWNGIDMVLLGAAPSVRPYVDSVRLDAAADAAMARILYTYAKDEHRALFESVNLDGSVRHDETGQRLNPGHALEALWFCLERAMRQGDRTKAMRCVEVVRWMFEIAWDEKRGGIVAFTKPGGGAPIGPEAPVPWGERWNDRIWWVHSEALCALAMAGAVSGDPWYVDAFEKLHHYVDEHFIDHKHGEWFMYLDCHGQVLAPQKGSWVKCFFHVPRNVMKLVCLLRDVSEARGQWMEAGSDR